MPRLSYAWIVLAFATAGAATGCSVGGEEVEDEEEDNYVDPGVGPGDGKMDGASSVQSVVSSTCSTVPVRGISMQIAEEIRCLAPELLVPFEETATIKFQSAAVLPYLNGEAVEAIQRAASGRTLTVNSGLRSVAQQYLIRKWRDARRCGIRAAAAPGRSNHETGRAVDLENWSAARTAMRNAGFSTLRGDEVHFDHRESPDLRSVNVEAFQRLWNRNHPEDRISESGIYDTATATRLGRSPSGGFLIGARCD